MDTNDTDDADIDALVARLYAAGGSILGLFLAWAGIAAEPWQSPGPSSAESRQLAEYERRLDETAALAARLTASRRRSSPVRIVSVPPVTTTRTS